MTTPDRQFARIGTLVLLIALGLTVAMAPVGTGTSAPVQESTQSPTLEEATVPDAVGPGEPFTVDASAIDDRDDVEQVCWLFDEDETCHGAETTHTFEEVGPHTATLVVTDEDGDRSATTNLIVATTAPTAGLTVPESVETGSQITFDASDSSDDHEIVEYEWDLNGDGTVDETTTSPELTHDFESTGTHEVSVTAVDAAGQTDTATATIDVADGSSAADDGQTNIVAILIVGGALALAGIAAFVMSRRQTG